VLAETGQPMNTRDDRDLAARALDEPGGKTPHATLYSAILREINEKGKDARFVKTSAEVRRQGRVKEVPLEVESIEVGGR